MPSIYKDIDVDVDIDVNEFVDECTEWEIKKLIKKLIEDGYLTSELSSTKENNLMDDDYTKALNKLQSKRVYLTLEEEEFIKQLANKY
jgi:hypothetical protein